MPAAVFWDQPGLTFDSALSWDAAAAPPRKTMNKTKANIDFSNYTHAELSPIAQTIHDDMTANAATFATPPVTMAALGGRRGRGRPRSLGATPLQAQLRGTG